MIKSASCPLSSHPDPSLETPAPQASRVFFPRCPVYESARVYMSCAINIFEFQKTGLVERSRDWKMHLELACGPTSN